MARRTRHQSQLDGPGMGYGPVPLSARRRVPRSTVVLAVVCLLLAAALAVVLLQRTAPTAGPAAAPTQTPTPGQTASAVSPTPKASPTSSSAATPGSDASERADEPAGVRDAATQFIRAWQEPSADVRVPMMTEVATVGLTEQLSDIDPAKISKAKPVGDLVVVQASDYAANADQRLSDKTTVRMQLVYEPASRYGWLVDTIVPLR
jgi:cytoskeletal protein RodZ